MPSIARSKGGRPRTGPPGHIQEARRKVHEAWSHNEEGWPLPYCGTAAYATTKVALDPELVTCYRCIRVLRERGELI